MCTHQIKIDTKVGWLDREAFRRVLPLVLIRESELFKLETHFTEEKKWFSSTFHITATGTRSNLAMFARVYNVTVAMEMT